MILISSNNYISQADGMKVCFEISLIFMVSKLGLKKISIDMGKKNKSKNKKPRFNAVEFKLDNIPPEELQTLKFGVRNNGMGIEIMVKTDERVIPTSFVSGYQRKDKPGFNIKQTNRVSSTIITNVHQNIDKFDYMLIVDTNSKIINNEWVYLGVVFELVRSLSPDGNSIDFGLRYITQFILNGIREKPENENWKNLIDYFMKQPNYNSNMKVGVVVDSDLGEIDNYNKRGKPIVGDFLLPDNFELIYASADAKNDSTLNKAINYCDKFATEQLAQLSNKS